MATEIQTRNEAAERLRNRIATLGPERRHVFGNLLDAALAAEYQRGVDDALAAGKPHLEAEVRRATVERIRERWNGSNGRMRLDTILDEEVAR